jgi:beta-glucosidase
MDLDMIGQTQRTTMHTALDDEIARRAPRFPPGFLLGAATAAYQIEGAHDVDGRGPSIWDVFSHTAGNVVDDDSGDVADDHYHRLDDDLDLMASLRLQAYRFSVAWPRIQATGVGAADPRGLDFYSRLVDGLLARDIQPIVTLYHWDLPQSLEDAGGWPARDTAYRFADYAALVGQALGDRVSLWTTLNEPWCSAFQGYASGAHAPGRVDDVAALTASHHLNLAHGLAVQELRGAITHPSPRCSITLNFRGLDAVDETSGEAIERIDALAHRTFLDPILHGRLSDRLVADARSITDWSFVQQDDLDQIAQPLDFLGVNYYSSTGVRLSTGAGMQPGADGHRPSRGSAWPGSHDVQFVAGPGPRTAMGWSIAPAGLEELLVALAQEFPGLPLMITENGAAFDDEEDDGAIHDQQRVDYLQQHLEAAHRAVQRGVDLRGYLVWSLLDNFEWAWGYTKRFGIVGVDYPTQRRIVKDSARWLTTVIEQQPRGQDGRRESAC